MDGRYQVHYLTASRSLMTLSIFLLDEAHIIGPCIMLQENDLSNATLHGIWGHKSLNSQEEYSQKGTPRTCRKIEFHSNCPLILMDMLEGWSTFIIIYILNSVKCSILDGGDH